MRKVVVNLDAGDGVPQSDTSDCPNNANHTPTPLGYLESQSFTSKMASTHRQTRCPDCGLYKVWVPTAETMTEPKRRGRPSKVVHS